MDNRLLPVFEIERFAIHDGPGIRTVVFCRAAPSAANGAQIPNRKPRALM